MLFGKSRGISLYLAMLKINLPKLLPQCQIFSIPDCTRMTIVSYRCVALLLFFDKATPIYLLVLRAQEVGNEPFWKKKKLKKGTF